MLATETILDRRLNLLRVLHIMFQTSSLGPQYGEGYANHLSLLISK